MESNTGDNYRPGQKELHVYTADKANLTVQLRLPSLINFLGCMLNIGQAHGFS